VCFVTHSSTEDTVVLVNMQSQWDKSNCLVIALSSYGLNPVSAALQVRFVDAPIAQVK
jgi:hypothetical protein